MLKRVVLALDSVNSASWTQHDVENICDFLQTQFPVFPDTGRIYHGEVSQENDVTPTCEEDIERLLRLPGPFFVVIYPGWVALPYIFAAVVAVAAYVLAPSPVIPPPVALARNSQAASPNNELSDRSNRARINGRIPDIYGTVRSTPDLIAAPYKIFENGREVEHAYMCIGRGSYDVSDVRDGATLCINIPGSSVVVYGPYTSPNSYDPSNPELNAPELVIGSNPRTPVVTARRSNSVNGQVLRPPNDVTFVGSGNVRFRYPNVIELPTGTTHDFTKHFVEGDEITITGATMTAGVGVTERARARFTLVNVEAFVYKSSNFVYNTAPGAMFFEMEYEEEVRGMFVAGSSVTIDTIGDFSGNAVSNGFDWTDYLNGTYQITEVNDEGPTTEQQARLNVPRFLVVKLDNPVAVNANWSNLSTSTAWNRSWGFTFDIVLSGSDSYDIDLNGTYTIVAVTREAITLDNPAAVAPDWGTVLATEVVTPFLSPTLVSSGDKWIGPFILDDSELTDVYCNFVAPLGLYKDDGTDQFAAEVQVEIELTPVDGNDDPLDDPEYFTVSLLGSTFLKETIGVTMKAHPSSFFGRTAIRARRTTPADLDFTGTVVDEVRWRDAYFFSPVNQSDFGNVTTVYAVTFATASALAVKDRKLNLLATRKIPLRVSGSTFSTALTATDDAAEIFSAICRDFYIGRRADAEMDFDNIYDTVDEVETYFGTAQARKFSYTFDNDNLSFEETAAQVADALHCVAYRRGNVIRLSFEKETDDSTLLFNHRNKIPKSEKRSVTFGKVHEFDGLEYTYVDPRDDAIVSIFLPPDYAASNPKKVESIGIRDHLQAYFLAWRIWNKMLYQNTTVEFDATQEADLLVRNDRILVADGTRPYTQDGEVVAVDSLELTLSQNVDLTVYASYVIFLQHIDGIAESIAITAGSASNKVVLAQAPRLALVTDIEGYARTTYVIVGNTEPAQTAFLVTEREPQGNMTSTVRAKNYDARYYANDLDFINELIDENGYGRTGGFTPGTGDEFPSQGNMTAATGCSGAAFGYVASDFSNIYYSWCSTPRGAWTGTAPTDTEMVVLQHTSSRVTLVLRNSVGATPPAQGAFTTLSFVDTNGTPQSFDSASATYSWLGSGSNEAEWTWSIAGPIFADGETYDVTFS